GGDWGADEIVGADWVTSNGGKVVSIPLVDGYSTSVVIDRLRGSESSDSGSDDNIVERSLRQHSDVLDAIRHELCGQIYECADLIAQTFRSGGKLLICGNGGSAADAQHIAAEFVGRYETERTALPAIALTTDTSALTALANDYGFERIFARQVESIAQPADCLLAISTSGTSANVIAAVMAARKLGCRIIGFTGAQGKKLAALSDLCVMIPSERTARIQEGHITIGHIICELIDESFADGSRT
ncbi:MAG: SIS domain-containing protein, partial [Gammaproteobacteria bacterium]